MKEPRLERRRARPSMGLVPQGPPGPKEPDSGRKPGSCSSSELVVSAMASLELGVSSSEGDKGLCPHRPLPGRSPVTFLGLSLPSVHPSWQCPSRGPFRSRSPRPEASASAQARYPAESPALQAPSPSLAPPIGRHTMDQGTRHSTPYSIFSNSSVIPASGLTVPLSSGSSVSQPLPTLQPPCSVC